MLRIEDIKFSPNKLFIASLDYNGDCIHINNNTLKSYSFNRPHGISFINDSYFVVANRVGNLHRHWNIPKFDAANAPSDDGELVNVQEAAKVLGVVTSTVHWASQVLVCLSPCVP